MRVKLGEVVDVTQEFTLKNLSIAQKVSAIIGATVADSKILGRRARDKAEQESRKRGETIDTLKDGILATIQYHLKDNRTLARENQRAVAIEIALERKHEELLPILFQSKEFNLVNIEYVPLDPDLVNSFGEVVPIILRISRKEV